MKKIQFIVIILLSITSFSCKKFLDEKQDSRFTNPQSLTDLQMLLDQYTVMNTGCPLQAELSADNYYLSTADFNALSDANMRSFHTWEKNDLRSQDWYNMYRVMLFANTVLENADDLANTNAEKTQARSLKAAASFYRGNALFMLAQIYAAPYDAATDAPYGLPLKKSADVLEPIIRSSVHHTYEMIINDFTAALQLDTVKQFPNRPTKTAAYAALARCYLAMENYTAAAAHADSALKLKNELINFNTLSTTAANPFTRFNKEVIFPAVAIAAPALAPARARVDTALYQSYHNNDLRKIIFFRTNTNGSMAFKGDYNASNNGIAFMGYTIDELYLIKAEGLARTGNVPDAMIALNTLLRTRWRTNTFTDFTAINVTDAVNQVLQERRKELCFRGQRWTDLRRLNKNAATQTTLTRLLNAQTYILPPQAPAYTLQLPADVIRLSNLNQNP